jgi:hypothetical protein
MDAVLEKFRTLFELLFCTDFSVEDAKIVK